MEVISVAVIIPCYNCEKTVGRAIDSVMSQTVLPRKLVLVDDASTDGTLQVLSAIARDHKLDWIEILSLPENRGPSVARNIGWNAIEDSVSYIAFLDADDAWLPNKLALQYNWMVSHPDAVLTCHLGITPSTSQRPFIESGMLNVEKLRFVSLLFRNKVITRSVMMKRSLKLRFDETKRYSEDYLLWLEVLAEKYDAYIINCPLVIAFKDDFGDIGLSSRIFMMELGELNSLWKICSRKASRLPLWVIASLWSTAKLVRRIVIRRIRRGRNAYI